MSTDLGVTLPVDPTERGRCGSCRYWTRTPDDRRWGMCTNEMVANPHDSARRGVLAAVLFTGDNFGCRHHDGSVCPTCGEPRRPK